MVIKTIEIKNFKSIEYIKLNVTEINSFVGKNGVGKSTIVNAIKYFYDNLVDVNVSNKNFDSENIYKNKLEITLEYDFSRIEKYAEEPYSNKLFRMLYGFSSYSKSSLFRVRMEQKKGEQIQWNIDYPERYIVYNSHPIYFCNTRNISLTNWDDIWGVVGDLINVKTSNKIIEDLLLTLEDNNFLDFSQYINLFQKFLDSNELSTNDDIKKQKVISLLQLKLGGKQFISKNQTLDYYSDGTNSQNYILFLSYIAYEISRKRLKDVFVVLDEPELGLHPKMIDELMEKIVDYSHNINFFIFSHSPRLISYVLRNQGELYNISLEKKYTKIRKIKKANEEKHKLIITERESSYFFSDFLLFVEGVSEIELFSNKLLVCLFPVLKKIDIINTSSNDHIMKMILPSHSNSAIPYLVLIDLDKLIQFRKRDGNIGYKFNIKSLWYSPFFKTSDDKNEGNLEKYLKFNYAKVESKKYIKIIEKIKMKESEEVFLPLGLAKILPSFDNVFKMIKSISLFKNIYVVRDTIEGSIINIQSNKYINKWRKSEKQETNIFSKKLKRREKVSFNRWIYSGKNDILESYKDADKTSTLFKNLKRKNIFEKEIVKKNSYWISDFFSYYGKKILTQKQYAKDYDNSKKRKRFQKDFPEIYGIIKYIEDILGDR